MENIVFNQLPDNSYYSYLNDILQDKDEIIKEIYRDLDLYNKINSHYEFDDFFFFHNIDLLF